MKTYQPARNISTAGEPMPAQPRDRRPSWAGRRAVVATAAVTALAIAAPVAHASAAQPTVIQTPPASAASVTGPTLIGDTFNGATVIVTSPSPAVGTVSDSR
jgi:hypothetical protein